MHADYDDERMNSYGSAARLPSPAPTLHRHLRREMAVHAASAPCRLTHYVYCHATASCLPRLQRAGRRGDTLQAAGVALPRPTPSPSSERRATLGVRGREKAKRLAAGSPRSVHAAREEGDADWVGGRSRFGSG